MKSCIFNLDPNKVPVQILLTGIKCLTNGVLYAESILKMMVLSWCHAKRSVETLRSKILRLYTIL